MRLEQQILELLATHAGQRVDYSAIYLLLNTVAGGHYEERFGEAEVRVGLQQLLARGAIVSWTEEGDSTTPFYRLA